MYLRLALLISTLCSFTACVGGGGDTAQEAFGVVGFPDISIDLIVINPDQKTLAPNGSFQFSASGGSAPYVWSLIGLGGLTQSGFYTAPATTGSATIAVTDSKGKEAFAVVIISNPLSLSPLATTVSSGLTATFTASDGVPPYTFSLLAGGGSINATTGVYDSTGFASGTAVIELSDANGDTAIGVVTVNPTLSISPAITTLGFGETKTFSASGGASPYVFSILSGAGTLNTDIFTAPSVAGTTVIRVTDAASNSTDATVTIVNKPIIASHTPGVGINENYTFSASSGTPPYTWSIVSGGGAIVAGTGAFTAGGVIETVNIRVTDSALLSADTSISVFRPRNVAAGSNNTCVTTFDTATTSTTKCFGGQAFGFYDIGFLGATYDDTIWGDQPGEMGDNLATVNVGTGVQVSAVFTYLHRTCVVTSLFTLKCFGYGNYGFLHNGSNIGTEGVEGSMGDSLATINLGTGRTIKNTTLTNAVAMGEDHICVILDNDQLRCWGLNNLGQLGLGDTNYRGDSITEIGDGTPNVNLGGDTPVQVSAGYRHTCVLLNTGNVKCFGQASEGQLGQGNTTILGNGAGTTPNLITPINLGTGLTAQKICSGAYYNCALLNTDQVKCWGQNNLGQLGAGIAGNLGDGPGEMGDALPFVDLGIGLTASDIQCGVDHACAIIAGDNTLKCWGRNGNGELGQGNTTNLGVDPSLMGDALPPVNLGTGRTVTSIFMGRSSNTCAILDNGDTKCFGRGRFGVNGQGHDFDIGKSPLSLGDNLAPISFGTGKVPTHIAMGFNHSCARFTDNTFKCWGQLNYGARGDAGDYIGDSPSDLGSNLKPVELPSGEYFQKVEAEYDNYCGLTFSGNVYCWGLNLYTFGLGNNDIRIGYRASQLGTNWIPIKLGTGRTATDLQVGHQSACALLDNGSVKCWGRNNEGQLGQGNTSARGDNPGEMGDNLAVTDLGPGVTAKKIANGYMHNCAITNSDEVKCWGNNPYGQLGNGNNNRIGDSGGEMGAALVVADMGTGRYATDICAGNDYSCALLDNQTVKCWGRGIYLGQGIGDPNYIGNGPGEMGDFLATTDLGTGVTALKIKCGPAHACAQVNNSGIYQLRCWGTNSYGRVGNGNTNTIGDQAAEMGDAMVPFNPGTNRMVLNMGLGVNHTCAVLENNDVKCFGYNQRGQLGQGHAFDVGALPVTLGDNLPAIDLD